MAFRTSGEPDAAGQTAPAQLRLTSAAVVRVSGPDLLQQTLHGLDVAPPPWFPAVTLPPVWAGDRERRELAVSRGGQATGEPWRIMKSRAAPAAAGRSPTGRVTTQA